jgi:hypothetical protein
MSYLDRSGPADTALGRLIGACDHVPDLTDAQRHHACRVVAGHARDVDDCRLLLDALGLGAA